MGHIWSKCDLEEEPNQLEAKCWNVRFSVHMTSNLDMLATIFAQYRP